MSGLRPVLAHEQIEILRLPVDRSRRIGEEHTVKVCQPHQLLLELIPGGANRDLSAALAHRLQAEVQPSDLVSATRKRVAMELLEDLERICQRKKASNKELVALVKTARTGLLDLHGIGPSGAA